MQIEHKFILSDGGELIRENIPLHGLGFLAQLVDYILNKREVSVDDSPSSVSSNLD